MDPYKVILPLSMVIVECQPFLPAVLLGSKVSSAVLRQELPYLISNLPALYPSQLVAMATLSLPLPLRSGVGDNLTSAKTNETMQLL